jgi:pSer/pThr/pTyr-binding forkhead associated (FHA) protein
METPPTPAGATIKVTFQVVDGIDKGRLFRDLPVPLTIGREEGNVLRLNDERVSRYHAKVQQDGGDLILTDLESTNGTRVNGHVIQIRRLRYGDRVAVGRSLLLFGSDEEINARRATLRASLKSLLGGALGGAPSQPGPPTVHANPMALKCEADCDFDLNIKDEVTVSDGDLFVGKNRLPPLPQKLTPSQAARLAEILDFLHHHLTQATDNIHANEEGTQVTLSYSDWQGVLAVQNLLARYLRAVAEPDVMEQ